MTPSADTREAFEHIESNEFAVHLGIASTWYVFEKCFRDDFYVKYLLSSAVDVEIIDSHLLELYESDFDRHFTNPHDHSMAVYLWVLQQRSPELALTSAALALETAGTFWVRRLAYDITKRPDPYRTEVKSTPRIILTEEVLQELNSLCEQSGYGKDLPTFILDAIRVYSGICKELCDPTRKVITGLDLLTLKEMFLSQGGG